MSDKSETPSSVNVNPVLIVEDHQLVIDGLGLFMREMFPNSLIQIADTLERFQEVLDMDYEFEALLLDPGLTPGLHDAQEERIGVGREALKLLAPDAPAVVLTGADDEIERNKFLELGYHAYLTKGLDVSTSLIEIFSSKRPILPSVPFSVNDIFPRSRITALPPVQEKCFLAHLAMVGYKTSYIAESLDMTPNAYRTQLWNAMDRLKNLD